MTKLKSIDNSVVNIQGDLSAIAVSGHTIDADSFVSGTILNETITVEADGYRYTLNPKKDLTAYELYNIDIWTRRVSMLSSYGAGERTRRNSVELAKSLDILRHFDIEETDRG